MDSTFENKNTHILQRMRLLGITKQDLVQKGFLEPETADAIITGSLPADELDTFEQSLLSNLLACNEDWLTGKNKNDFLSLSYDRQKDDTASVRAKARIQIFLQDFAFLSEIQNEVNTHA